MVRTPKWSHRNPGEPSEWTISVIPKILFLWLKKPIEKISGKPCGKTKVCQSDNDWWFGT